VTALRRAGWTEDELAKLEEDQKAEQAMQPTPAPTLTTPAGAADTSSVAARIEAAAAARNGQANEVAR
jgi:hypothetical protein